MLDYTNLIMGCPTWNVGELQEDWEAVYNDYGQIFGKTAAFFGCGDQVGYSDNFLDAIGMLAKPFMEKGGNLIGRWSTEGYELMDQLLDGDEF